MLLSFAKYFSQNWHISCIYQKKIVPLRLKGQKTYTKTMKTIQLDGEIMSKKPHLDLSATHHQIATYLTDYALSELVRYVMEDTGCNLEQAMAKVYNSSLMTALQDEENELYIQSPAYLYELMNRMS